MIKNQFRFGAILQLRRGAQARSTKQKARIERFEALVADKPAESAGKIDIAAGASRLGKKVIECRHLYHEFPQRGTLIEDFNYSVARNDRVGIIGPNGMGKFGNESESVKYIKRQVELSTCLFRHVPGTCRFY